MKFLQRLLDIFYPNYNDDTSTQNKNHKYGISFELDINDNININISLPDQKEIPLDNMVNVAEKYAQLILAINKGLLTHQVLQTLSNRAKNTDNVNEQLFIDNVISLYDSLKKELNKIQTSSSPLIKPMSVFRIN
jgi:hypothetical protein